MTPQAYEELFGGGADALVQEIRRIIGAPLAQQTSGACRFCGRLLTSVESVEAGAGSVCLSRHEGVTP